MLVDSSRDHGVYVTLACAFFMSLSLLALALRIMSRWPWKELFNADDTLAVIATVLAIIQGVMVLTAVDHGLGKIPDDLTQEAIDYCAKMVYASDLVFVLAVYASNVSAAISLARFANLTKHRHRVFIKVLTAACAVTFVVSVIVVAVQHGAPEPQLHKSITAVQSTAVAWVIYVILGGSLNLAIAIYPCYLVLHLQMPNRDKWKVGVSYGLRMILVPICALRIRSLALADRSNFPYGYAFTEIFTQAEMCYALISATIPCLRPFLVLARTGLFDLQADTSFFQYSRDEPKQLNSNPSPSHGQQRFSQTPTLAQAFQRHSRQPSDDSLIPTTGTTTSSPVAQRNSRGMIPRGPPPRLPAAAAATGATAPIFSPPNLSTTTNPTAPSPILPRGPSIPPSTLPIKRYARGHDEGPARGRSKTVASICAGSAIDDEMIINRQVEPGAIEIRQKIEIHRSRSYGGLEGGSETESDDDTRPVRKVMSRP